MPVTPSYPGVYIEEVPSGVHTITGVSTSIAAFLGRTAIGPIDKAVRCLSMSDFNRSFGAPHPDSDLAQSVRQFFDNGGVDCYVVRLAAGAQAASITLQNSEFHNVLTATAKSPGVWGNGLRLEVDYNTPNPDETFNLTVIQMDAGNEVAREQHRSLSMDPQSPRFAPAYVTQSSALIDLNIHNDVLVSLNSSGGTHPGFSQSRAFKTVPIVDFRSEFIGILENPKFMMSVDEEQYVPVDLSIDTIGTTWSLGEMATSLQDRILSNAGLTVTCHWIGKDGASDDKDQGPNALRITAGSGLKRSVRIRRAAEDDFAAPMMLGVDQGGIEVTSHSWFRPVPNGAFYHDPEKIINLAGLITNQTTKITINTDPQILFDLISLSPNSTSPWFQQLGVGVDGIREKLRAIAQAVNASSTSKWKAEVWGYHLAFYAKDKEASINLKPSAITSVAPDLAGTNNFICNVRQYALGTTGTGDYQEDATDDNRGLDGDAPELPEFTGNEADQTGFHALDSVDLFNLMVIPGDDGITEATYETLWGPASIYCQNHRAMLLINAPAKWTQNGRPHVKEDTSLITDLRAKVVKDYSAVFYPNLIYVNGVGLRKTIGPAGAIAGLMARTDSTRGVWKAPAGIEADIRGIAGLEIKLTDMENGVLNKLAVNCLRAFPSGFVNWGARTMYGSDDDGSEWKYIPIRRLALFLEESLYRGTKWVVFEPNDEPLWAKIRLNLGAFMMGLFRQGAFQGSTPDKAFYVKCDDETTTQADRNLGIVNIEVGFAPLKPAEFVIIKIQQIAGQL